MLGDVFGMTALSGATMAARRCSLAGMDDTQVSGFGSNRGAKITKRHGSETPCALLVSTLTICDVVGGNEWNQEQGDYFLGGSSL